MKCYLWNPGHFRCIFCSRHICIWIHVFALIVFVWNVGTKYILCDCKCASILQTLCKNTCSHSLSIHYTLLCVNHPSSPCPYPLPLFHEKSQNSALLNLNPITCLYPQPLLVIPLWSFHPHCHEQSPLLSLFFEYLSHPRFNQCQFILQENQLFDSFELRAQCT